MLAAEDILDLMVECNKKDYSQAMNIISSIQSYNKNNTNQLSVLVNKHATSFLTSLIKNPPTDTPDIGEFFDIISSAISSLCGRTASTSNINNFDFQSGTLFLHESNFADADLGFQTWDGGVILTELIDSQRIIIKDKNVLELGSGTGICGLLCGRMGAKQSILTDYNPIVLETLQKNINLNSLQDHVRCLKLDWNWCIDGNYLEEDPILSDTEFEIIIAADCVYEMFNANAIPIVAKHYRSKSEDARFHLVVPLRFNMETEIRTFEKCMIEHGWVLRESYEIEKTSLNFRYYCYR